MSGRPKPKRDNRYRALIEKIFVDRYTRGTHEIPFLRTDIEKAAKALKIKLPKNLGDVIYSIRYRIDLPESIRKTQPRGLEWIVEGVGRAKYSFRLSPISRILPNAQLIVIKIPDATPEIVDANALTDEQALLAKLRYNRLIDIFLGIAGYSLQSHLRTTASRIGQVEIDELYVGVDKAGKQYVVPVQAKGGNDRLSAVQTQQDMAVCSDKFPNLICRPVSAQFIEKNLIALFELRVVDAQIKIADEKHYRLTPASEISADDLKTYKGFK